MADFTFNGQSSNDFSLRVKNAIVIPSSERDFEIQEVPGVDGDLFISRNRLKSVDIVFPCRLSKSVFDNSRTLFSMHDAITSWLCADENVHNLTFSDDSSFIYKALFISGERIERITSWAGDTELSFRCYPWKYSTSGQNEITISGSSTTLTNPFVFPAKPKIKVSGSGTVTITFTNSGTTQTLRLVNLVSSETITIDCDTEEVYSGNDNRSARVSTYPFPELRSGATTVSISGTHSVFKITPNWRMKV